jgi:hexulose-6-phosphate isomerase
MRHLTIMQGRLTPPVEGRFQAFPGAGWEGELALASDAGLDGVELIYEGFRRDHNPLASDDGARVLPEAAARHGVVACSVCADRFMESPVVAVSNGEREALAEELRAALERWGAAGIERIVLPFVDANSVRGGSAGDVAVEWIRSVLPAAEAAGIELHLETDLGPAEFSKLLDRLAHPMVRVNYDTGNSAALGYCATEELEVYGDRVGSVHVKDRVRDGGTVPLGEGHAELEVALVTLRDRGYDGDVVLQVARGTDGDEVAWARRNAAVVRELWAR